MPLSATANRLVLVRTLLTACVLLLSSSSSCAFLRQHPVLLPAKIDPSKCLECHNDKATWKDVHTAILMGCTGYHSVANVKGATYITLSSPVAQLCFTRHTFSKSIREVS